MRTPGPSRIAAPIGLALGAGAALAATPSMQHQQWSRQAADLVARNEASQAALLRGDVPAFLLGIGGLSADFVLMSPMGGEPSRAAEYTPERLERMGRFFRNGTLKQDVVAVYEVEDMVVLATIERAEIEVGGLPRQPWALRVTSVFVRRDGKWVMAHRHADPLVDEVPLAQSARLARGERDSTAR